MNIPFKFLYIRLLKEEKKDLRIKQLWHVNLFEFLLTLKGTNEMPNYFYLGPASYKHGLI